MVPALAWSTTYAPLVQHDLELLLVDCNETWNSDTLDSLAWTAARYGLPRRLVIGCSILGNPGHLEAMSSMAHTLGAYYIEDNAESPGAIDAQGQLTGTRGLMNTFSFFITHQISAIEGGMILTNDDECAKLCRQLRAYGWTRDTDKPNNFSEEYDFLLFGYNTKPMEMHAAIGREQLRKLPQFAEERRANYDCFFDLAEGLPIIEPKRNGEMVPFGIHFTLEDEAARDRAVKALRENGIDCRMPTGGSFRMHKYGKPWANQATPNADRIHRTGLFIGNAPFDISARVEKAVTVLRGVL